MLDKQPSRFLICIKKNKKKLYIQCWTRGVTAEVRPSARIRADLTADRGNGAEVNFTVPKLTKLFVVHINCLEPIRRLARFFRVEFLNVLGNFFMVVVRSPDVLQCLGEKVSKGPLLIITILYLNY